VGVGGRGLPHQSAVNHRTTGRLLPGGEPLMSARDDRDSGYVGSTSSQGPTLNSVATRRAGTSHMHRSAPVSGVNNQTIVYIRPRPPLPGATQKLVGIIIIIVIIIGILEWPKQLKLLQEPRVLGNSD